MVLRGVLLCAALAALPGCKQSLFDDNVGGDGDGDGDGDGPDAAGPSECPDPCIADLTGDYDGSTGGSNGLWAYLSDARDRTWTPMTDGEWMGLPAKIGGGTEPFPAIVDCRASSSAAACEGVGDRLLFVPSGGGAGYHDPAAAVEIGAGEQYRVSGTYRATGGSDVDILRIYRNTGEDLVGEAIFDASAGELGYDFPVEAVPGDRLFLAVRPQGASAPPVGVQQYISRNTGAFPGGCGLTLRFSSITGPQMQDDCGVFTYSGRQGDGAGGYVDFTPPTAPGPTPEHGTGIRLAEDQYLLPTAGGSPDYSGSFTIQMWVRIEAFNFTDMFLWSNWANVDQGGLTSFIDSSGTFGSIVLFPTDQSVEISFPWPTDQAWHFLRIVRDADAGTYKACLDGQQRATTNLDGALDVSSTQPPYIGRNVDYNPPYFQGELDDIRFFTRALPCR